MQNNSQSIRMCTIELHYHLTFQLEAYYNRFELNNSFVVKTGSSVQKVKSSDAMVGVHESLA